MKIQNDIRWPDMKMGSSTFVSKKETVEEPWIPEPVKIPTITTGPTEHTWMPVAPNGADIYISYDGTDPDLEGTPWDGNPIEITTRGFVKIQYVLNDEPSEILTQFIDENVGVEDTYWGLWIHYDYSDHDQPKVAIDCPDPEVQISYSIGTDVVDYTGPFNLDSECVICAVGIKGNEQETVSAQMSPTEWLQFSDFYAWQDYILVTGEFITIYADDRGLNVVTEGGGWTIYYDLDGNDLTVYSNIYDDSVPLIEGQTYTVKVIGINDQTKQKTQIVTQTVVGSETIIDDEPLL